jgi:competence ComEA-like helix-hairpin-helix protein
MVQNESCGEKVSSTCHAERPEGEFAAKGIGHFTYRTLFSRTTLSSFCRHRADRKVHHMADLHDSTQPPAPQLPPAATAEPDARPSTDPASDGPAHPSLLERREAAWAVAGAAIALLLIGLISIARLALSPTADTFAEPPQFLTDINSAPAAELALLPGIGPQLAARIVAQRQSQGPFTSADDLLRVHGIGPKTLQQLRPLVICSEPAQAASPAASDREHVADAR